MSTSTNQTLSVLICAIDRCLLSAVLHTSEAAAAMNLEKRNLAIGTLLVIEQDLELVLHLFRATIALHRTMKEGAA